jgi:hypothetical protein
MRAVRPLRSEYVAPFWFVNLADALTYLLCRVIMCGNTSTKFMKGSPHFGLAFEGVLVDPAVIF